MKKNGWGQCYCCGQEAMRITPKVLEHAYCDRCLKIWKQGYAAGAADGHAQALSNVIGNAEIAKSIFDADALMEREL